MRCKRRGKKKADVEVCRRVRRMKGWKATLLGQKRDQALVWRLAVVVGVRAECRVQFAVCSAGCSVLYRPDNPTVQKPCSAASSGARVLEMAGGRLNRRLLVLSAPPSMKYLQRTCTGASISTPAHAGHGYRYLHIASRWLVAVG